MRKLALAVLLATTVCIAQAARPNVVVVGNAELDALQKAPAERGLDWKKGIYVQNVLSMVENCGLSNALRGGGSYFAYDKWSIASINSEGKQMIRIDFRDNSGKKYCLGSPFSNLKYEIARR